jgi:hypothetical protein
VSYAYQEYAKSATHQPITKKGGKLYGFGEVLIVHGTHTNKKGSVNVEFKVPAKKWSKICKP